MVVPEGSNFYALGGLYITSTTDLIFEINGNLTAVADFAAWPLQPRMAGSTASPSAGGSAGEYAHFIEFHNNSGLTVTGNGVVDGFGVPWWERYVIGECGINILKNKPTYCPNRPKLFMISNSDHLLVESITLMNSPSFNLQLNQVAFAEVRYVSINTDIVTSRLLKAKLRKAKLAAMAASAAGDGAGDDGSSSGAAARSPQPVQGFAHGLQPEDLNTDGIDSSGHDVWIHHCSIYNDDDSIAVKPSHSQDYQGPCSENMLIEDTILSGFGASIGSVPPNPNHNCVRNITFKNITMPRTGKGVYVKSNPHCEPGSTGEITNIVYEDVSIVKPEWWPIWIGPQQQQEPGSAKEYSSDCSLEYPIVKRCPTQGCVTFTNITMRNIHITAPWFSPGVILGNKTNPMQGIVFDNVTFDFEGAESGLFPFGRNYQCAYAFGASIGSTPDIGQSKNSNGCHFN